jgi:hypothetical protein
MMKNIALVLRCIAMAIIALVGSTAEGSAQEQGGFFVESEVRAMQLLDETAPVVGLRIGHARPNGLGFDLGVSALVGSPSRNPGPFRGDTIQRLGRLFLALRYDGVFTDRLRFDLGGVVGLGYADAEICEGTDVCVLSSGYVGAVQR